MSSQEKLKFLNKNWAPFQNQLKICQNFKDKFNKLISDKVIYLISWKIQKIKKDGENWPDKIQMNKPQTQKSVFQNRD